VRAFGQEFLQPFARLRRRVGIGRADEVEAFRPRPSR